MSKVYDSLVKKVTDRRFGEITHEEWAVWRLKAKDKLPRFVATVIYGEDFTAEVDIYHKTLVVAAGTAAVLFQIGLPGISGKSIKAIRLVSEDGIECQHLTSLRDRVVDLVGAH